MLKLKFLFVLIVLVALVGCKKQEIVPVGPRESPLSPLAVPTPSSPLPTPTPGSVRFYLDRPVVAGATEMSGRGPVGIPLEVVDITTGGEVLGSGVIDADGRFSIALAVPVQANRAIGIRLATAKDPDTWLNLWALRGEKARAIPQVGDFFDTVVSSSE